MIVGIGKTLQGFWIVFLLYPINDPINTKGQCIAISIKNNFIKSLIDIAAEEFSNSKNRLISKYTPKMYPG